MDKAAVGIIPYGMDLLAEGTLGPGTIGRLRTALRLHYEFPTAEILVSAGLDPTRPRQMRKMSMQMADWLIVQGVPAKLVRIEAAKTFNTEGEQDAAISCGYGHEIHTSAWWHLLRIIVMRRQRGVVQGTKISYRPCWDIPPLKGGLLEIGKFFICLLLPKKQQQALAYKVKKFIRTSY